MAISLGEPLGNLQQQRRLADPRLPTKQDHSSGNEASTEETINLSNSALQAIDLTEVDAADRKDFLSNPGTVLGLLILAGDQCIPLAAVWAAPEPLHRLIATVTAAVGHPTCSG